MGYGFTGLEWPVDANLCQKYWLGLSLPTTGRKKAIKIFSGLLVGFYYLMVVCWLAGSRPKQGCTPAMASGPWAPGWHDTKMGCWYVCCCCCCGSGGTETCWQKQKEEGNWMIEASRWESTEILLSWCSLNRACQSCLSTSDILIS